MTKKRTLVLTVLSLLLSASLTGCIIIPLRKHFEIDPQTVSYIDIYDLRDNGSRESGFMNTEKPVYTVPAEQNVLFLEHLANIRFSDTVFITIAAMDPSFYYGKWVACIHYTDGSYEFLSNAHYGEVFDKDGNRIDSHHYGCDADEWEHFIGSYLPDEMISAPSTLP